MNKTRYPCGKVSKQQAASQSSVEKWVAGPNRATIVDILEWGLSVWWVLFLVQEAGIVPSCMGAKQLHGVSSNRTEIRIWPVCCDT